MNGQETLHWLPMDSKEFEDLSLDKDLLVRYNVTFLEIEEFHGKLGCLLGLVFIFDGQVVSLRMHSQFEVDSVFERNYGHIYALRNSHEADLGVNFGAAFLALFVFIRVRLKEARVDYHVAVFAPHPVTNAHQRDRLLLALSICHHLHRGKLKHRKTLFDFGLTSVLFGDFCAESFCEVAAIVGPLVRFRVLLIGNRQLSDQLDQLKVPDAKRDVCHGGEGQDVPFARGHRHGFHLGDGQGYDGQHFSASQKDDLLWLYHDQVGALWGPLHFLVRDIFQANQLLLRLLTSHCKAWVKVVDDDIFA